MFELSLPRATGLDMSSNRLPWSAPWMTNKEATRLSLLGLDADIAKESRSPSVEANPWGSERQPVGPGRGSWSNVNQGRDCAIARFCNYRDRFSRDRESHVTALDPVIHR